ncbi:hypothetical protein BDV98DRAFT_164273 [Pterulicium gracile]|uniref:Uncharacterized protein n=1 Tax=Pterulicium gracile TaxID=1884261 RepID=A0A5C3QZK9_9AGAR|nr:hypothetical protein BDV98DRAFT_164273 [Pterula gracilis]
MLVSHLSHEPDPSPSSSTFRAQLAKSVSANRHIRPRAPFWRLPVHTIPTLWTLYRGLLRNAPTANISFRVKTLLKENKHLTAPQDAAERLKQGYRWLELFRECKSGNERAQAICSRFDRLIGVRREKEYWNHLLYVERKWLEKMRNRPIMTGGLLRASYNNAPLPRLKPQPLAITMMLYKRRSKREPRLSKINWINEWTSDLHHESKFEGGLLGPESVYSNAPGPPGAEKSNYDVWVNRARQDRQYFVDLLEGDNRRITSPVPETLVLALKAARTEKIRNKTHERERERSGEVLRSTLQRRRRGVPAETRRQLSPARRRLDRVSREEGEVGFVRKVKADLGMRIKDDLTWRKEKEFSLARREEMQATAEDYHREFWRRQVADSESQTSKPA